MQRRSLCSNLVGLKTILDKYTLIDLEIEQSNVKDTFTSRFVFTRGADPDSWITFRDHVFSSGLVSLKLTRATTQSLLKIEIVQSNSFFVAVGDCTGMILENQRSEVRQSLETCLPTGIIPPSTRVETQPQCNVGHDDDSSATTDDQAQELSPSQQMEEGPQVVGRVDSPKDVNCKASDTAQIQEQPTSSRCPVPKRKEPSGTDCSMGSPPVKRLSVLSNNGVQSYEIVVVPSSGTAAQEVGNPMVTTESNEDSASGDSGTPLTASSTSHVASKDSGSPMPGPSQLPNPGNDVPIISTPQQTFHVPESTSILYLKDTVPSSTSSVVTYCPVYDRFQGTSVQLGSEIDYHQIVQTLPRNSST